MSYDWDCLLPIHSEALHQLTFFKQSPDEFLVERGVSIDEMNRWHENGWLSFDPATIQEYDEKESIEVLFIKAVVRFGISDAMVNRLFSRLDKPYCYDPKITFFSFEQDSWITLPPKSDPKDTVSEGIEALIENEEWEELRSLMDRISEVIEEKD